jgi:SAM-dependent methyltransferase
MSDFWDKKYLDGHQQKYPWDIVVSFLLRAAKRSGAPHKSLKVLEVGFGTGANLSFAAHEGFHVSGIEISPVAVDIAQKRFNQEKIEGNLRQGSFTKLPFEDKTFDFIIDRGSLTCVELDEIKTAIGEISRVSKPKAQFLFNCYADSHSSARSGAPSSGRTRKLITEGTLAGMEHIAFLSANDVSEIFQNKWRLLSMSRQEITEMVSPDANIHSEWRVIAERL